MNKLSENMRLLISLAGISEARLAERTGIPQPTINRITRGQSLDPRDSTLRPLAEFFGVSVETLRHGDVRGADPRAPVGKTWPVPVEAYEVQAVEGEEAFDADQEVWVDAVDVEAAAGPGGVVPEFVPTKYRQRYTLRWFRDMGVRPEDVRIMGVRGDSMEPTLYASDRVAVNLADQVISSGRVYAFLLADEARIKRLFRMGDGRVRIVSDNPDKQRYPDEYIGQDALGFALIGRVIERKGTGGL